MFNFRLENTKEYYPLLQKRWKSHNFPDVHILSLPENVFVASNEYGDVYSCFMYLTNSKMVYIAYPLSNLEIPKENREGGLEYLIENMLEFAKDRGYLIAYTTSPIKPVQDALLSEGFVVGDPSVVQYFKIIT